jgi:hypothetical protein
MSIMAGEVDAEHVGAVVGKKAGDVPGSAAHVGDDAAAGELDERCQERALERLAVELVSEAGVVGASHRVVGSAHIRRLRPGHFCCWIVCGLTG